MSTLSATQERWLQHPVVTTAVDATGDDGTPLEVLEEMYRILTGLDDMFPAAKLSEILELPDHDVSPEQLARTLQAAGCTTEQAQEVSSFDLESRNYGGETAATSFEERCALALDGRSTSELIAAGAGINAARTAVRLRSPLTDKERDGLQLLDMCADAEIIKDLCGMSDYEFVAFTQKVAFHRRYNLHDFAEAS